MRTLRIYPLNHFPICHRAVLAVVIMLKITSLILTYFVTLSLYLLTTFLQFPLSLLSTSDDRKSDLFFYDRFTFIIYLFI